MIEKDLKFLDFILPILSDKYPDHISISELSRKYKKEKGVEIDYRELPIFVDNYNYEYFEQVTQMRAIRITPEWKERIDIFGSVSLFIERVNEKIEEENNKQKEIEALNKKVSELSIINLGLDWWILESSK
ncbi:hypothetical protein [Draconibacterium orientale]|uniref:hypothetical protein n=1 Tax=Draconibacterium orientale TaxID=1168034 RepID=UPI0029C0E7E2|nr:hypothetical protein [Draconibacterium orientale]